jgi:lipoyl synthase
MNISETKLEQVELPRQKRPEWLKVRAPGGDSYTRIKNLMRSKSLHTVCEEAHCPNIGECWNSGTATFMILGDICIRGCRFCAVTTGKPLPRDPNEPLSVAESVKQMGLKHVVITSVTRDDLPDGGAVHWAEAIEATRFFNPEVTIEVLIPDFQGDELLLKLVLKSNPDILNHNIETVPRMYPIVRPKADYKRSLKILQISKNSGFLTKTGIMVGVGETKEEVFKTMKDLRKIDVNILTIGQYLQPSSKHLPVARFVHPDEFKEYHDFGLKIGFDAVESAPLVRSSYHAGKIITNY